MKYLSTYSSRKAREGKKDKTVREEDEEQRKGEEKKEVRKESEVKNNISRPFARNIYNMGKKG